MDVATGHVASSIRSVANQRIRRVASSPLDAPVRLSVWNGSHPFPPRFIPFPCVPPYPSARRMVNAVILSSDYGAPAKDSWSCSTLIDGHQRDRRSPGPGETRSPDCFLFPRAGEIARFCDGIFMELVTEVILIFLKLFPAEIEVPSEMILRFQEGFEISRGEPRIPMVFQLSRGWRSSDCSSDRAQRNPLCHLQHSTPCFLSRFAFSPFPLFPSYRLSLSLSPSIFAAPRRTHAPAASSHFQASLIRFYDRYEECTSPWRERRPIVEKS